ncbi:DUF4440 domain-containing protein [Erythrobacter arachoides]|uniref:DUF4440 domain-containing protein n=1 Tax=Aurantiacibacter arachoides TaxID=1850444 RepID=A0A844ZWG4_9SPHN|nr:DUF4440 domain-containing protein [Aurantiacibacter arachoides]MXO92078.1 DUF4440 domain-containing protein [Aurantiacibacter arachoides]GGD59961.1 hypothetical protein GCM10011411_20120 [Aurantiacibacter arachoides]
MNDDRIWEFERELWLGGGDVYREKVASDCIMALPAEPILFDHGAATKAVEDTPRWSEVAFAEKRVTRPEEGLIVIGYRVHARREGSDYHALCTSTLQRLAHEEWVVIQHQQTPFGIEVADPDAR